MDKEKILLRSRNEQNDEGLMDAENQGRKLGVSAFTAVFCIIVLLNFFYGKNNDAAMAMYFTYIAAEAYPKYKFTGKKYQILIVLISGFAALYFLLCFIFGTLR